MSPSPSSSMTQKDPAKGSNTMGSPPKFLNYMRKHFQENPRGCMFLKPQAISLQEPDLLPKIWAMKFLTTAYEHTLCFLQHVQLSSVVNSSNSEIGWSQAGILPLPLTRPSFLFLEPAARLVPTIASLPGPCPCLGCPPPWCSCDHIFSITQVLAQTWPPAEQPLSTLYTRVSSTPHIQFPLCFSCYATF